jgi:glycosyltransferase involved in cell wall biosynthesis
MKEPISILVPAYNTQDYIEETLDSIQNQSYFKDFNEYEIVVGVDGWEKVLEKLSQIRSKYINLRILNMPTNKGLGVVRNTLIYAAKYDVVTIFDSDDIMYPQMIEKNMEMIKGHDLVSNRFRYMENGELTKFSGIIAEGVFTIRKYVFKKLGGFRSRICAADTKLRHIFKAAGLKETINPEHAFIYRRHDQALTMASETNYKSAKRAEYIKEMQQYVASPLKYVYIKPVINTYKEI